MRTWYAAAVSAAVGVVIGWALRDPVLTPIVVTVCVVVFVDAVIISTWQAIRHWFGRRSFDALVEDGTTLRERVLGEPMTLSEQEDAKAWYSLEEAWWKRADHLVHIYAEGWHQKFRRALPEEGTAYRKMPKHRSHIALSFDKWLDVLAEIRTTL